MLQNMELRNREAMVPRLVRRKAYQRAGARRAFMITLAALLAWPGIAQGQNSGETAPARVLTGLVRDSAGNAVEGVEIREGARLVALTDSSGRFRISGLTGSSVTLAFRRLGYNPETRAVGLRASADAPMVVMLVPNSLLLRTIVVEGRAYDEELWKNGFYHRQKTASGSFFDSDFLMHFGGDGLGSVLHEVPRVEVMRSGNRDYAFSTVGGNRCRMNVYIDGLFQRVAMPGPRGDANDAVGLNDLIDFRDIRAIEVYPRTMSVPIQFSRMGPGSGAQGQPMPRIPSAGHAYSSKPDDANADAACGAVVIWTKAPGER